MLTQYIITSLVTLVFCYISFALGRRWAMNELRNWMTKNNIYLAILPNQPKHPKKPNLVKFDGGKSDDDSRSD